MGAYATIRSAIRSMFSTGSLASPSRGAWMPIVREPYTGAWQNNDELRVESLLANPTVFRCVSLIASDIGKLACRLVALDADGIWVEASSPAFTPVLRSPNRYQTPQQFFESWLYSKLLTGNAYMLKDRDARGVVVAMYVLDPAKVKPLVGPDGSVYYEIQTHELAGIPTGPLVAPAREVIHDRWNCVYHPLVGISPLYACGGAARQGLAMEAASTAFFNGGGRPSGLLVAPTQITDAQAADMKAKWSAIGNGQTAVVGNGVKYEAISSTAVDSQWIEQAGWVSKAIAGCYGVPISMVDSSQQPPYAAHEASTLQYHSQCLQTHLTAIENALDVGLELPSPYGTEFDLDDLIWMDTATKTAAARDAIAAGALSPNEARRKYFGVGPVPGGDSPMAQQQYYSLEALAMRDAAPSTPAPTAPDPAVP